MSLQFEIQHSDTSCRARLGRVTTAHGTFDTPAFMAVGTRGSVKGLTPVMLREAGCQIILGNTYHLLLRPGPDAVATLGGLQKFSGWNGPMLTDSGGFQVFSLSQLREFDAEGVTFRSHIDGSLVRLGPKESMRTQFLLGADIAMAFDDCPPADCGVERLAEAMERTIRWARVCKEEHERLKSGEGVGCGGWVVESSSGRKPGARSLMATEFGRELTQSLFGIVQGGTDPIQRKRCAEALIPLDFDGYALGGLAVGEGHERMVETLETATPLLPTNKPRYLMGVGYAKDILEAVKRGVDMFDCVLPTRNGRNALAFTYQGTMRLRNAKYALDDQPLEPGCDCYCCQNFSRGYLRHLFSVQEMLGPTLVSLHNVRYFQRWMLDIRRAIRDNALSGLKVPGEGAEEAP
ncbi:MAG: tRNA guanosine(34) transglycosylase Tgt [Phycisphaerae bacterium]